MSNTPTFSDFYSLAQFTAKMTLERPHSPSGSAGAASGEMDLYYAQVLSHRNALKSAAGQFVTALRDAGQLPLIDYTDRREHRWAQAWNRFVQNDPMNSRDWDLDVINEALSQATTNLLIPVDAKGPMDAQYAQFIKIMDEGQFKAHDLGSEAADDCGVTGQRLGVDMLARWAPRLGVQNHQTDVYTFTPITHEAPPATMQMHSIPAPSGEMLVTDWFRFSNNVFTDIVTKGKPTMSLNTDAGCQALTQYYASTHGFMSVAVGDRCPSVLAREDHAVICNFGEDTVPLQGELKGSICTDLHWATMIDKEVMLALMATVMPLDKASKMLSTYCQQNDVVTLQMPPGRVYFHNLSTREDIADFECEGPAQINLDGIEEFLIALSSEPLTWRATPAPGACAKARRP